MNLCTLRKLKDSEIHHGLTLLQDNLQWLEERGIRQWSGDFINKSYPEYQKMGENYVFECENQIVAVHSIHKAAPSYWQERLNSRDYRFLSKLAVDVRLRGQGIGRQAIQNAQQLLRDENVQNLFIEISHEDGFLVQYYKKLNFIIVERDDVQCESGVYDMVLMKCPLSL